MKIKSTPLCSFCNQENESIMHLLYECRHIKEMLEKLIEWLNTNTNNNILLNKADYILGSHDQYALNMIYLFTKAYVYEFKLKSEISNFDSLKFKILSEIKVLKYIHTKNDTLQIFRNQRYKYEFLM